MVEILYGFRGMLQFVVGDPLILGVGEAYKFNKVPQMTIPELQIQDFFDFKLLLTLDYLRDWNQLGLALQDFIRDIAAHIGDGNYWVYSFLMWGKFKFDGSGGYGANDLEWACPFVVQLLCQAVGCVVL